MEIAVIGNSDFILGFRLAGVEMTIAAESDQKLAEAVTRVLNNNSVGILVLKGSDIERLPERIRTTLEESVQPTVITIGGAEGGVSMREKIKRAVGVDLWK